MRLAHLSWIEVNTYLEQHAGIIIPLGSTEQHGPTGLIGTDAICAETIAWQAAESSDSMLVAPTMAYTPAQFNLGFAGSVSIRSTTLITLLHDIVTALSHSGFRQFYFLNGHGANLAPVRSLVHDLRQRVSLELSDRVWDFRLRSWWDFPEVNALRSEYYGEREGMHATPSEISITRVSHRQPAKLRDVVFKPVSAEFLREHAGDAHLDATRHREQFPDGCVGSDPTLATAQHGKQLIETAAVALVKDFTQFTI